MPPKGRNSQHRATPPATDWKPLEDLLLDGEDQLVDRFFHYAGEHDYTRYTSTLREAWRMSAVGITEALVRALRSWERVPELTPDESYSQDPISAFGQLEARRHRERGISLTMFLGLFKYFRQAYHDLLGEREVPAERRTAYDQFLKRAFDRFELGFLEEWTSHGRDDLMVELQATNRRLANEKNKYLTIFESISSPVLFVSARGRLENLNHAATTLLLGESEPGAVYYREGGLQAHLSWLVPWLTRFEDSAEANMGFELSLNTTRGPRRFEGQLQRMLDDSQKFQGTIVILNDVTTREQARSELQAAHDQLEQRVSVRTSELRATANRLQAEMAERIRAEDERESTRQQLLHAQKLEAIGTLAGGVAHDLNNLLQMVLGNTELMRMEMPADPKIEKMSFEVLQATERAAALVRQLLLFSRKQPMRFQPVMVSETTRGMVRMLQRLIGEQIEVATLLDTSVPPIHGDPGSIEQVLMNLVLNARDAMPRGGTITIRCELVRFEPGQLSDPGAQPGRYACLGVEDDGCGMDEATRQRIFEPFFTTKGVGRGTGLGLAVVYGIVKKHQGWIHVNSEPGVGTAFEVYLPVMTGELTREALEATPLERLQGKGERILLVEDEVGVRGFTAKALEQAGYRVAQVDDGREAIDLVRAHDGEFSLIVSDVILPGLTGPELIRRVREFHPEQRVLYVSGYTAGEASQALEGEGDRLLPKPYGLRDLLQAVHDLLADR